MSEAKTESKVEDPRSVAVNARITRLFEIKSEKMAKSLVDAEAS
jgi:hypothetical protein